MIKFFRKIRYQLLGEGKTGKYLKYAIGEVVLVVIGILIALSINNWNEYRKDRVKETEILQNLSNSLKSNYDHLARKIFYNSGTIKSIDLLLDVLEQSNEFHDTLSYHFTRVGIQYYNLNFSRSGYEAFKNIGFDIVERDSLRNEIINLFEVRYVALEKVAENHKDKSRVRIQNFMLDNFKSIKDDVGYFPNDMQKLSESDYYKEWLASTRSSINWINGMYEGYLKFTLSVLEHITEELEKD